MTANRRSALHIASENNRDALCTILLENQIDANLLDANQNTGLTEASFVVGVALERLFSLALHLAVQHGHTDVVRRLLSEPDIDPFTVNAK